MGRRTTGLYAVGLRLAVAVAAGVTATTWSTAQVEEFEGAGISDGRKLGPTLQLSYSRATFEPNPISSFMYFVPLLSRTPVARETSATCRDLDPMICRVSICESAQMYLGGADPKTPLASPLYGNLAGFPPTLIHVGTAEVLHDDATRLAARLREAGGDVTLDVYEDMLHVWHLFAAWLPEGADAIARVGALVRSRVCDGV